MASPIYFVLSITKITTVFLLTLPRFSFASQEDFHALELEKFSPQHPKLKFKYLNNPIHINRKRKLQNDEHIEEKSLSPSQKLKKNNTDGRYGDIITLTKNEPEGEEIHIDN